MRLFLGGYQDHRLLRYLTDRNPGFPHIRKIHVHADPELSRNELHERSNDSALESLVKSIRIADQAQNTLCLILERLPESTLECFEWLINRPLSVSTLLLLCRKQKRLANLCLMTTEGPLFPELEKNPDIFREMTSLSSLYMCPNTFDMLQACGKLVHDSSNVQDLMTTNDFRASNSTLDDMDDFYTHPGLYTRTMFNHFQPFDRCMPLVPKHLGLERINLYVRFSKSLFTITGVLLNQQ